MWNFLVSGLSIGCTLVLYDGSPLRDPTFLWRLTDDLGITIFGTSAKYIDQLSVSDSPLLLLYKPRVPMDCSSSDACLEMLQTQGTPQAYDPSTHLFYGLASRRSVV